MKKWKKKLMALLTMAIMVCAMLPTTAFAAWGDKFEPDQTVSIDGKENNVQTIVVVYHANYNSNYDYRTDDNDIKYVVNYTLEFTHWNPKTPVEYELFTAQELGFTADGYVQDADDPWTIDALYPETPDYVPEHSRNNYQSFDFKGGDHLAGVKGDSTTGEFWNNDGETAVHLYANWESEPKKDYPTLDKQIVNGDSANSTSVNAGDTVKFSLTSNVPADLWKCFDFEAGLGGNLNGETDGSGQTNLGTKFEGASYTLTFHDTMADQLSMNDGTMAVKIGDNRTLTSEDYTYTTETGDGCSFHVTLDLVDLYEDGTITDNDYAAQTPIVVTYDATLSSNATAGTYTNTSHVSWDKNIVDREDPTDEPENPTPQPDPDDSKESEEDEVEVDTYDIKLTKIDNANGALLAGATFKLEKQVDGGWVDLEKTQTTPVDNPETNDVNEAGIITWSGLEAGTYRLTEIEAPDNYVLIDTPVVVTVPDDADDSNIASITFRNGQVPATGGNGTMIFTIAGVVILGGAAVVLAVSHSRKKKRG